MCGRFSLSGDLDFYLEYFGVEENEAAALPPSWNVAPTDPVYAVVAHDGRRVLDTMRWGLLPDRSGDRDRRLHINSRIEAVATTPAFRHSFARRRCLIPADGFYEWEPAEAGRTPHWVFRADGRPLALAGIWAGRRAPGTDGEELSCSIVTTAAEGVVAAIHDRMPVMLEETAWELWLDPDLNDPEATLASIRPIDPDLIMEHLVSSRVNSVRNNDPELSRPAQRETLF